MCERQRSAPRGGQQQDSERGAEAKGFAEHEVARTHAEAQDLAERAALAFACQRAEREQHDEQRHEQLQSGGGGQFAEAAHRGGVLRGEERGLVLSVRFEEDGGADEGFEAAIEHGQPRERLEDIHAVMAGRVGILFALIEPVLTLEGGGGVVFGAGALHLLPREQERNSEQHEDHSGGDAEAAVAPGIEEFFAGDGENHARRCFR